ncbi:diguanylate cyclase [Leucothrix sargassi]|nr:diguanylate cyclase [Leucothrix sargassi]
MKIKYKLTLPSLIGLALIVILIEGHWKPMQLAKARDTFKQHTHELLVSSEASIIQQLLERDLGSLYSNLNYLRDTYSNRWSNITLKNEDGKRLYPLFQKNTPEANVDKENIIHIVYPLSVSDSSLGQIEMDVDWEREKSIVVENLSDIRNMVISMVLIMLFITTLSQYQTIYRPLKKLNRASQKIKDGQFNVNLPKITSDEIGELTQSFSEMSAELAFQRHAVDEHAIVSSVDKDGKITDVNERFLKITGYSRSELIGQTHQLIRSDMQPPSFFDHMWETIISGKTWHGELCNINKQGEKYWVSATILPFMNEKGVPERYVSIRTDITKQKKAEERLKYLATHDTLTGLPTRRVLQERLVNALSIAKRNDSRAAVLFIDLDGFKAINDTFGHKIGDLLLQSVSQRLRECIREVDTVARLGGDEFIVVLSDIKQREAVAKVAQSIVKALSSKFVLDGNEAFISASIGITLYPDHGTDAEMLIIQADDLMYTVKRAGKNNFAFYDTALA